MGESEKKGKTDPVTLNDEAQEAGALSSYMVSKPCATWASGQDLFGGLQS